MANFYSSNDFYLGFASQSAWDTAASSATSYLRADRGQSGATWNTNVQVIQIGYGDIYSDTDTEIVNPGGTVRLRCPWTPSKLAAFLLLSGIPTGAASYAGLQLPEYLTFFHGAGAAEDVYYNCGVTSLRLSLAKARNSQRAMLDMSFVAGAIAAGGTPATVATLNTRVLAYERPYHLTDLTSAVLIGNTSIPAAKIESLQLDIAWDNQLEYLARSDSQDLASDLVLLGIGGVRLQIQRSYNSTAERTAFLQACSGYEGPVTLGFTDSCLGHTMGIKIPKARYTTNGITHAAGDYIKEALTIQARRDKTGGLGGSGNEVYSPIGFQFT